VVNWYAILKVEENVTGAELERRRDNARRKHHPDSYTSDPQDVKDWHAAQLKMWLEGVAFLLSRRTREMLDNDLRQQRAYAADLDEKARGQNHEGAKRRGDASVRVGDDSPFASTSFENRVAQRAEELRSLPTQPDRSALQAKLKRVLVILVCNVLIELVLVFGMPDLFFHAFAHWQAALFDFVDEGSDLRKTIVSLVAGWVILPVILIGSCALTLQGFAAKDWRARVGGYVGAVIAGFFWGIQAVALVTMGHTVRGFWS
jgi:hypothetical protein